MSSLVEVGVVKSLHGKNKLKIINFIDPESFSSISQLNGFVVDGKALPLKTVSFYKNYAIAEPLSAQDICNLAGKIIVAQRSFFPEELLPIDLVGMEVFERKLFGRVLYGKIADVSDFGAGPIIEIVPTNKPRETELYPFTEAVFPRVDTRNGYVLLRRPKIQEGTFD